MTRIFKKPVGKKGESNLSDGTKNTPIPSRFLKREEPQSPKRSQYLEKLNQEIFKAEKKLESIGTMTDTILRTTDEAFQLDKRQKEQTIGALESQLILKREERKQLEAPFVQRDALQNERDARLAEREKALELEQQRLFEKDRECESKLEGVKDLADELGETRLRLTIKEKMLGSKESVLRNRETQYLLAVEDLNARQGKFNEAVQEREYAIGLREMNIQSKDENISKREEALLNEKLLVDSKRQALLAAQSHGRSIK